MEEGKVMAHRGTDWNKETKAKGRIGFCPRASRESGALLTP